MDLFLVEIKAKMLLPDAMKLMELLEKSDDEDLKSYMESFEASIEENVNFQDLHVLRRCPFCDGTVKASTMTSMVQKTEMWRVHCENDKCTVQPSTPLCKEKEDAEGIWNGTKI